jgi:transposase
MAMPYPRCARKTFVTPLPESAPPFARRTRRVADLALLLVHAAGGRPAERLMKRPGLSQSDDTLLRSLKRQTAIAATRRQRAWSGSTGWSWLKGASYGTIMVDLERREVLDVLADRSADGTAAWLARRPEVEIISRDRCGLYAEGAKRGAPQARQVADRFHLIQNLRQSIQQRLSRAPLQQEPFVPGEMEPEPRQPQPGLIHRYGQPEVTEHRRLANADRRAARRSQFDQLKSPQAAGKGLSEIVPETGLNWSGCLELGRQAHFGAMAAAPLPSVSVLPQTISCVVAAALCIKPRGLLTAPQAEKVDLLKATSPDFAMMRQLTMRFHGVLRGRDTAKLDAWLDDARDSGIHCLR